MIKVLIQDCHHRINKYKSVIEQRKQYCVSLFGTDLSNQLEETIIRSGKFFKERRRAAIEEKMSRILPTVSNFSMNELVHNISDRELNPEQINALSHEANFNTSDAKPINFIAEFENILSQTDATEDDRNAIRQKISSLVVSHKPVNTLTQRETRILNELKSDKDITILPADKGRSTVVMNKSEYTEKIEILLSDREAYKTCEGDPMKTLIGKINRYLNKLKRSKAISQNDWLQMKPTDSAMARFYGLPKIHKEGNPLRPIVSYNGSPTYGLAKWLYKHLKHLTKDSDYSINSSGEFLTKLNNIKLEADESMISFDVSSLFTSIPRDLAIETMGILLADKFTEKENTPKIADFLELIKFCLTTYFTNDGIIYEQIKGTPMGSPLSGLIAEAVLQRLEYTAFSTIQPKFWARYVDDTFVIVNVNYKGDLKNLLCSIFDDIHFTVEEEVENKLPFLDVLVTKTSEGSLETSVYRKATNTLQVINFNSNHPLIHKKGCVRTLFGRVKSHCNTQESKRDEIIYLNNLFRFNNYPPAFIKRYSRHINNTNNTETRDKPRLWRSLPYIKDVSEAAARILRPFGIGIGHHPNSTIRNKYMNIKEPLKNMDKSAIIYKIDCKNCPANYIGETSKCLKSRLHEHKLAVRRADPLSQISSHCLQNNHEFAFEEAKIIGQSKTKIGRLVHEAWNTSTHSINRCIDLQPPYQAIRHEIGVPVT
jgi:hypothetical protein